MARARRLFSSTARACGGGELILAWHVESELVDLIKQMMPEFCC